MTKYKLVPLEPTPEMVRAAEDAHMPFGDMELAIRMAILEAPEVEQEPVAWLCVWPEGGKFVAGSYESAKNYRDGAASVYGEDQAPRIRSLYLHPQPDLKDAYQGAREDLSIWKRRALEAEKNTDQLVEALELIGKYPCTRDEELGYPKCREIARTAIAAYRKGGEA